MDSMNPKPTVGFLGPQPYMQAAIESLRQRFDVHLLNPKTWDDEEIDQVVAYCQQQGIEAVGGFAQKDAFHHLLINEKLGTRSLFL